MNVGDKLRIVKVPPNLPEGDLKTATLFQCCVGHMFPVVGFQGHLLELEVGEIRREPAYFESIWIEPEFVELVQNANSA
jgi:hypothetical protein